MKEGTKLCELHNYIFENFELSREARYLIINIFNYIERLPESEHLDVCKKLLGGSIGLEIEEIERFLK